MLRWALIFLVVAIVAGNIWLRRHHDSRRRNREAAVLSLPGVVPGFFAYGARQPNVKFPDPASGVATRSYLSRDLFHLLAVVVAVAAIAALYFARIVLIPFALALLFTFILTPVVRILERTHLRRIPSTLLVVLLTVGACGAVGWMVAKQLGEVANQLPAYKSNIKARLGLCIGPRTNRWTVLRRRSRKSARISLPVPSHPVPQHGSGAVPVARSASPSPARSRGSRQGPCAAVGIGAERSGTAGQRRDRAGVHDFHADSPRGFAESPDFAGGRRASSLGDANSGRRQRARQQIFAFAVRRECLLRNFHWCVPAFHRRARRVCCGAFSPACCAFCLTSARRSAAIMPLLLSLAVFHGWTQPLLTLVLFIVTELVVSNFIEPMLYGIHTGISSLAILVAAIFWTAIWGPIGLVLSTPLRSVCWLPGAMFPGSGSCTFFWATNLSLTPSSRFYQRLLAMDHDDARRFWRSIWKGRRWKISTTLC